MCTYVAHFIVMLERVIGYFCIVKISKTILSVTLAAINRSDLKFICLTNMHMMSLHLHSTHMRCHVCQNHSYDFTLIHAMLLHCLHLMLCLMHMALNHAMLPLGGRGTPPLLSLSAAHAGPIRHDNSAL